MTASPEATRQSRRLQDDRRLCCLIVTALYFFPRSSGNIAKLTAIRRASSLVTTMDDEVTQNYEG